MLIAVIALLAAQAGTDRYTREKEAALGRYLAAEVGRATTAIESAGVRHYVDQLVGRLVSAMPEATSPFTVTVTAEDRCAATHEPVALPGGFVFVPAALFTAAESDQEFAAMVAHAMAHAALPHGRLKPLPGQPADSGPVILIGEWAGNCGSESVVPRAMAASLRDSERAADALAVRTLARAGLDPHALLRFVERMPALPDRDTRLAALRSILAQQSIGGSVGSGGGEFAAVQEEVRQYIRPARVKQPSLLQRQ